MPLVIVSILQLWPVSAILLVRNLQKVWRNSKLRLYRRFALIIGDRPYVRLWEIARATGKTKQEVREGLQEMIDAGYLGRRAYLDQSTDCIVIDPERRPDGSEAPAAEAVYAEPEAEPAWQTEPVRQAEPVRRPEPARRAEPEPARPEPVQRPAARQPEPVKRPQAAAAKPAEDEFEKILREIRELNDRIADGPMSQKIDRIGEITASIFMVLKLKPERRDEVQKFMSYYLPTTMKLLESYSLLEKQSYQGENIVAARQDIEKIIDTMIPAFEKQLDRLFKTDALDISTDIDVLEAMMAKDGLTQKEGTTLKLGR